MQLREITRTFRRRDRSVVRSSVIPSAKYWCPRSSLRSAKGSTAIDRRGAMRGGVDTATGGFPIGEWGTGHTHQATIAMDSATEAAAAIVPNLPRPRRRAAGGTLAAGNSATTLWLTVGGGVASSTRVTAGRN